MVSVVVYNKAMGRKGPVPLSGLSLTQTHNAGGTATFAADLDHNRTADLLTEGARVIITLPGVFMSGSVFPTGGDSASGTGIFTVTDDFDLVFRKTQGWPVPAAGLGAQTVAYYEDSGPAESVVKRAVTANRITRLGSPVVCATDLARGANIAVSLRFHPLFDRLFPAVDQAGIGVTCRQIDGQIVVDAYVPPVDSRPKTMESGVIQKWSYSASPPTVTRVVMGDQGEAAARGFTGFVDTDLESRFGTAMEGFGDARDTDDAPTIATRAAEKLAEGAPKYGFSVELGDGAFSYGRGLTLGQQVTLQLGSTPVTDVLRQVTVTLDDNGLVVKPQIGERRDDPNRLLAQIVAQHARDLRNLNSTR
jgi:hypothetical protein